MKTRPTKSAFVDDELRTLKAGTALHLSQDEIHHLVSVRRAREGELIRVCDGRGGVGEASIAGKTLLFQRLLQSFPEPAVSLHLRAAQLKPESWEWLLEKATECAVQEITPIISERVEPQLVEAAQRKGERFQRICIDAIKQSGIPHLPRLHEPLALEKFSEEGTHVVAVEPHAAFEPGTTITLPTNNAGPADLQRIALSAKKINLWIGPEGGWSPRDLECLARLRPSWVTYAPTVFRAETAALFFVSVIRYSSDYGRGISEKP